MANMTIEAATRFPGFRFSPTDVELINYYLKKKMEGEEQCVGIIAQVEICSCEPWDLPVKSVVQSDNEWFFFSSRGRKYPNGMQSRRATELGYWKATGKERNVKIGGEAIGTKRTLVFHIGRAPKGERTEWIMHEYSLPGRAQDSLVVCRLRKNPEFRTEGRSAPAQVNSRSVAGGGSEWIGGSEGERAGETSRKYGSSSHDSHSVDQVDSACNSAPRRPSADPNPAASSSQLEGRHDDEEDFFADILNDEIINLGETMFPQSPPRFILPPGPSDPGPVQAHEGESGVEAHHLRTSAGPAPTLEAEKESKTLPGDGPYTCFFTAFLDKASRSPLIATAGLCAMMAVVVLFSFWSG